MMRSLIGGVAILALVGAAHAQDSVDNEVMLETAAAAGAGTADSAARVAPPGPSVDVTLDSKRARLSLAVTRSEVRITGRGTDRQAATTENWTLRLAGPLDRSDDNFVTVDGFADALSLEASLIRYRQRVQPFVPGSQNDPRPRLRELRTLAIAMCRVVRQQEAPNESETQREQNCNWDAIVSSGRLPDYLPRARYDEYYRLGRVTVAGPMLMYGGNLSIGGETNEFLDPVTFAPRDQVDTPWKVSAFLGLINPEARNAIVFGVTLQRSFQDQASQTVCGQPTPTPSGNCRSGPVGPPADTDSPIVFGEVRQALGEGRRQVAVAFRIEHDFERDLTELTLPLYLFRTSANSGLTGGFQLRWTSEDEQVIPGVFLSASPYRLFGG